MQIGNLKSYRPWTEAGNLNLNDYFVFTWPFTHKKEIKNSESTDQNRLKKQRGREWGRLFCKAGQHIFNLLIWQGEPTFAWVRGIINEHGPNVDDYTSLLTSRMIENGSPLKHQHHYMPDSRMIKAGLFIDFASCFFNLEKKTWRLFWKSHSWLLEVRQMLLHHYRFRSGMHSSRACS